MLKFEQPPESSEPIEAFGPLWRRLSGPFLALAFVIGAGATGATVTGFLGRYWWAFDLTAHFRPQLYLALVVTVFILDGSSCGRRVGLPARLHHGRRRPGSVRGRRRARPLHRPVEARPLGRP